MQVIYFFVIAQTRPTHLKPLRRAIIKYKEKLDLDIVQSKLVDFWIWMCKISIVQRHKNAGFILLSLRLVSDVLSCGDCCAPDFFRYGMEKGI